MMSDLAGQDRPECEQPTRRVRRNAEQSREQILDAVERLILRAGYGAVNTRSVALEAGMKPPLVHYHFATTENLLLESYRRSAKRADAALLAAITGRRPIHALWDHHCDTSRSSLAAQYMALAGQHAAIREEMAHNVDRSRAAQISVIDNARRDDRASGTPDGAMIATLIAAAGRAVSMERAIGASTGHAALIAEVGRLLDILEPADATVAGAAATASRF